MNSTGMVSNVNARMPAISPRAIPKGHAIANKNKFMMKWQPSLQKIPNGIKIPANIGPSRRTIGARRMIAIIFVMVQQKC